MKTIKSRKVVMLLGGILTATLATGCFGGGPGYSNDPYGYGYNSNYGSYYGNSYPYRDYDSGYSYPQSYRYSYNTGYRDNDRNAVVVRDRSEARTETRQPGVARENNSGRHSEPGHRRSNEN